MQDALEVLDQLREELVSGRASGFIGVTIADDDSTCAWVATTKRISRLRSMGAVTNLLQNFVSGEI